MSPFALWITGQSVPCHGIAPDAHGLRLVISSSDQLTSDNWDRAVVVLIDMTAGPVRWRLFSLAHGERVNVLARSEDSGEPGLNRHAIALGVVQVFIMPNDTRRLLRKQIKERVESPPLVAAVITPSTRGREVRPCSSGSPSRFRRPVNRSA
jgi:hypothetical protein